MESEFQEKQNNQGGGDKRTPGEKRKSNNRKARIVAIFAIIEVFSLVLWQQADEFSGFSAVIIHWVSKCGFLAGGAYLAHEFSKQIGWIIIVWLGWASLCLLMILAPIKPAPSFKIIPRLEYIEMKTPRHFLMWNINGRYILSPINVIMLVQLTNFRDKPMKVNSYQFEGKTTNNTWEIMPTINMESGGNRIISFVGTNWGTNGFGIILGPAKEGDVYYYRFEKDENIFPNVLSGKTIEPGGVVDGFVFLEGPKHGFNGQMRCRILDATDNEFTEIVESANSSNYLKTSFVPTIGTLELPYKAMFGEPEDVKKLDIIRYSEEWK